MKNHTEQLHARVRSARAAPARSHRQTPGLVDVRDGRLRYAIGLPSELHIFPSVTLSNLIDHGISVPQAVQAPRLWTRGHAVKVEASVLEGALATLRDRGHRWSGGRATVP
ncbi:hypothetical protein [Mesorhizobium sp. M0228]|uniref:hypothetical protein n=1 Tax=Mesorhizobium sp. M0228 TaxID=2956923 RepID=UPI0033393A99